jgi:hypothetical protein
MTRAIACIAGLQTGIPNDSTQVFCSAGVPAGCRAGVLARTLLPVVEHCG